MWLLYSVAMYVSVNQSIYALKSASEQFPETFENYQERKFEIVRQFDFVFNAYIWIVVEFE